MINLFKYSDNEEGFISCLVKDRYVDEFKTLGFCENPDDVKKPTKKKAKADK